MLILIFGPISGAHFNPAVTLAFLLRREIGSRVSLVYVAVQVLGGLSGIAPADAPLFIGVQIVATVIATVLYGWLFGTETE